MALLVRFHKTSYLYVPTLHSRLVYRVAPYAGNLAKSVGPSDK